MSKTWMTIAFLLPIAMMTGCAKDRATHSGCCETSTTFSQNCSSDRPTTLDRYHKDTTRNSKYDSSRSLVQNKICPVTGESVDSMGGSIPVLANGYTISVCCEGCISNVQKDPAKYLAIAQRQDSTGSSNPSASSRDLPSANHSNSGGHFGHSH